jgi:hypothetical protein
MNTARIALLLLSTLMLAGCVLEVGGGGRGGGWGEHSDRGGGWGHGDHERNGFH